MKENGILAFTMFHIDKYGIGKVSVQHQSVTRHATDTGGAGFVVACVACVACGLCGLWPTDLQSKCSLCRSWKWLWTPSVTALCI